LRDDRAGGADAPPVLSAGHGSAVARDLLIVVALPGVESGEIEITAGPEMLVVAGVRRLPAEARGMAIQRLEIPQGRFERRIRLPSARWELRRSTLTEGCLLISLARQA
jgi:HSP20 family protein